MDIDVSSASAALHNVADYVGYSAIDNELLLWIESDHDLRKAALEVIRERSPELLVSDTMDIGSGMLQALHRAFHPNGPYGWEYCGRCKV